MTRNDHPSRAARLALVFALCALGLGACSTAPEPKPKADAGGPDKSLANLSDVQAGSVQDFALNASRRTFFRENSAELDAVAKTTLDKQASWLNRHPTWRVNLQGFSDDPGTPEANTQLSAQRAEAARGFLISVGVAPERIEARGFGRTRLVRDCPDLSCKAQNRRVVSELVGQEKS